MQGLGCICILYFLLVAYHTHLNSKFPLCWLIAGVMMILAGGYQEQISDVWMQMPDMVRTIFTVLFLILLLIVLLLFCSIIRQFHTQVPEGLTYMIILGAQMKSGGPSLSLQRRLDRAYDYLVDNQNTIPIVSGGKGSNEPMTEAMGMKLYLEGKGIESNRILMEDKSVNTHENLLYSRVIIESKTGRNNIISTDERKEEEKRESEKRELEKRKLEKKKLEKNNTTVGIVTSNFHVYRAIKLAAKLGYDNVYGIPSRTEPYMLPTAIAREIVALIKDYLWGHI